MNKVEKKLYDKIRRGTATDEEKLRYTALTKKQPPINKADIIKEQDQERRKRQKESATKKESSEMKKRKRLYDKIRRGTATEDDKLQYRELTQKQPPINKADIIKEQDQERWKRQKQSATEEELSKMKRRRRLYDLIRFDNATKSEIKQYKFLGGGRVSVLNYHQVSRANEMHDSRLKNRNRQQHLAKVQRILQGFENEIHEFGVWRMQSMFGGKCSQSKTFLHSVTQFHQLEKCEGCELIYKRFQALILKFNDRNEHNRIPRKDPKAYHEWEVKNMSGTLTSYLRGGRFQVGKVYLLQFDVVVTAKEIGIHWFNLRQSDIDYVGKGVLKYRYLWKGIRTKDRFYEILKHSYIAILDNRPVSLQGHDDSWNGDCYETSKSGDNGAQQNVFCGWCDDETVRYLSNSLSVVERKRNF